MRTIIFLGNARDFHAMDWYRTIQNICPDNKVYFATDLIESEGHAKLVKDNDLILPLFNIDKFLFKEQSNSGNIWRNLIKVLIFPFQIPKIKKLKKNYPNTIFHAHTMYYMFLGWVAKINYIGTPQGSEILVRPYKSCLYKYFAKKALVNAKYIIVDSLNLQNGIKLLSGKNAAIIQNGIDVKEILKYNFGGGGERDKVLSIRGMYPNYRLEEIFLAREKSVTKPNLTFFYPFWEDGYKKTISRYFKHDDVDLARISEKADVYKLMFSSLLAISIPKSDSSPRSVYEAIFCGCCIALTYHPYIELMPKCMRERVFIVQIEDPNWFDKALSYAKKLVQIPFVPTQEALNRYDQNSSMAIVAKNYYLN